MKPAPLLLFLLTALLSVLLAGCLGSRSEQPRAGRSRALGPALPAERMRLPAFNGEAFNGPALSGRSLPAPTGNYIETGDLARATSRCFQHLFLMQMAKIFRGNFHILVEQGASYVDTIQSPKSAGSFLTVIDTYYTVLSGGEHYRAHWGAVGAISAAPGETLAVSPLYFDMVKGNSESVPELDSEKWVGRVATMTVRSPMPHFTFQLVDRKELDDRNVFHDGVLDATIHDLRIVAPAGPFIDVPLLLRGRQETLSLNLEELEQCLHFSFAVSLDERGGN